MRLAISRFSCKYGYLRYPLSRSLAVLSGFSLPTPLNRPFRRTAAVSLLGLWSSCNASYRNINRLSIRFASRLPLRSRLTLSRLTLLRKPWVFGVNISIFIIVTYAYIFFSRRSSKPHGSPSTLTGMLPYHALFNASLASATVFMPGHHPRITARLVSCYALFE